MTSQPHNTNEEPNRVDVDKTSQIMEQKTDLSTTKAAAKHYAEICSWAVFSCVGGAKHPATQHGCKDATKDSVELEAMFEPGHNLGVATGTASGLFVLDIDGAEGEASLTQLVTEHGELPRTVTVQTPRGGRHLYFRLPEGQKIRNSASKLGTKLDVRGEGGYVVAPPSRLPNGVYTWSNGLGPDSIEVTEAPNWLLELVVWDKPKTAGPLDDGQVPEGERNATLTSLAGSMRHIGFYQQAIEAALLAQNDKVCHPPLPSGEVCRIAKSVARYEFGEQALRVPSYKPFPTDALPEPFRAFVEQTSEAIGCDASYVALPLLAGAASAIGNSRRIQLKAGWDEPAILWTAIVGDSGTMKSPALEAALKPIKNRQQEAWKGHEFVLAEYDGAKAIHERDLTQWKKGKSASPPPEPPPEPIVQRTWADDLTVEALAVLLLQQPRGLLVTCDELASWLGGFDRYSQGSGDSARWLEMHGGRSMVIDRKTGDRKTIYIPRASVSVTGGIQPGVLRRALTPQHRESGLAARLLLACPPRKPKVWNEQESDPELSKELQATIDRLYDLRGSEQSNTEIVPVLLPLSAGAKTAWLGFFSQHAEEQVSEDGDLAAAWSKLEGATARLALVLHLVENPAEHSGPITLEAMRRAIRLTDWFKHETRRVYGLMAESDQQRDNRVLLERIQNNGGSITPREMQRGSRRWKTSDAAEQDLEELKDAGLGSWTVNPPTGKGGRPGRVFHLASDDDDDKTSP